jgi:hypothetical protein
MKKVEIPMVTVTIAEDTMVVITIEVIAAGTKGEAMKGEVMIPVTKAATMVGDMTVVGTGEIADAAQKRQLSFNNKLQHQRDGSSWSP